ncbi:uncharacterized protein LOC131334567 [Rhododendron vialii]|uniref:uncharacterized protein LOC131334567 n=1 Tax=Rhododendron vialii TaxID=182163 RepID=UPI00265F4C72|nr:uncharacterized protein LOC131334567 [Rhododendron vialii]
MEETYQIYVKLLDGKHRALNFPSPSIPLLSVKNQIRQLTGVPISQQRLLTGTKQLDEDSSSLLLHPSDGGPHPTLHLLLRLRGGKGGFGSLLRGAATKAGQKKTNNFDACRDMSGRRLRHVNAEKKLEEWKAEAEERRLEKVADEFIKKKAKAAGKKAGVVGEAEKYVEKYREESARCMEAVEKAVREAVGNSKRKVAAVGVGGSDAKRFKIWMGKRTVGGSGSDDSDEDDSDDIEEDEDEKSVILDGDNHLGSSKEAEGSLDSVTGRKLDEEPSVGGSSESGSEGEDSAVRSSFFVDNSDAVMAGCESNGASKPILETQGEVMVANVDTSFTEEAAVSGTEAFKAEKQESDGPESGNLEDTVGLKNSSSEDGGALECGTTDAEVGLKLVSERAVHEESVVMSTDVSDVVKPLNYDEFNSAAELEALGMERLKSELQSRGLKCGGTLQERAARLFLLKTTPLEMLPKKLLAKK